MVLKKNLLKGEGEGVDILFALLQMHAVQNIRTLAFFPLRCLLYFLYFFFAFFFELVQQKVIALV